MMLLYKSQRFTEDATEISLLHDDINGLLYGKKYDIDQPTRRAVFEILLNAIGDVEEAMTVREHIDPTIDICILSVSGDLDPKFQNPVVDMNSSWNSILRRLRNQIEAVLIMANSRYPELVEDGDEKNALDRVKQILRTVYSSIHASIKALSIDLKGYSSGTAKNLHAL